MDGVRSDSFIEGRESPALPGEEREEEEPGSLGREFSYTTLNFLNLEVGRQ